MDGGTGRGMDEGLREGRRDGQMEGRPDGQRDERTEGPYSFWHKSSSWVEIRLHAKHQLPRYSGSGLKVSVASVWCGVGALRTNDIVTPT